MEEGIYLLIPLVLLVVGFTTGRIIERRHIASLHLREAAPGPTLTNLKRPPEGLVATEPSFCCGSVVIAGDYFKAFGASLKTLVGGRMRTLETVLDRGRREAIQRMREQAAARQADMILDVRLETAIVMRSKGNQGAPATEVIAYGTAVKLIPGADG